MFEIAASGSNWTIKEKGGQYVYVSGKNKLGLQDNAADWTISFDNGDAKIGGVNASTTYYIRRNSTQSTANPFRAYASGQDAVQLYKKQEAPC